MFRHQDSLERIERVPRVVVTSYTMLKRLQKSMFERRWAVMIVDESHNIHCTKKGNESAEVKKPSLSNTLTNMLNITLSFIILLNNKIY